MTDRVYRVAWLLASFVLLALVMVGMAYSAAAESALRRVKRLRSLKRAR